MHGFPVPPISVVEAAASAIDATGCGPANARADRGPYQQVHSGKAFYLLNPLPEDIDPRDIVASLSKLCRYNGHCTQFYSVAEHSILVASLLPPGLKLAGLLHDAAEAYMGDVTRPMKLAFDQVAPGVVGQIERGILNAIDTRFYLRGALATDKEAKALIKHADNVALATERAALMPDTGECDWGPLPEPLKDWRIQCCSPMAAEAVFSEQLNRLAGGLS